MEIAIGNGFRASSSTRHLFDFTISRNRIQTVKMMMVWNSKKANLSAAKKQRINLPVYDGDDHGGSKKLRFSEFLSQQSGIEAVLNTNALQSFEFLGDNTYRCTLPAIQLLSIEAAPVLDLRVTQTDEDCLVEMLSCKFEGSELLERQNDSFSAFMTNRMTWDVDETQPFLEVDVKIHLTLEISGRPFSVLPISAVEAPGNLMMRTLLDTLVTLLLQQLLRDYHKWVHHQLEASP